MVNITTGWKIIFLLIGLAYSTAIRSAWSFASPTLTGTLGPSSSETDFCSCTYAGGVCPAATCNTGGGSPTDTNRKMAAKAISATNFMAVFMDTSTNTNMGTYLGSTPSAAFSTAGNDATAVDTANSASTTVVSNQAPSDSNIVTLWSSPDAAEPSVGASMIIRVYNRVAKTWTANESATPASMTTFTVSSAQLAQASSVDVTCQFSSGDDTGSFTFSDGTLSFVISCTRSSSVNDVTINWGSIPTVNDIFVHPRQATAGQAQSIGFFSNGIYIVGLFAPPSATNSPQGAGTYKTNWMEHYQAFIGNMKIHELVISGARNSGAIAFSDNLLFYFYGTQNTGSSAQTQAGARYYEYEMHEETAGAFTLAHSGVQIGASSATTATSEMTILASYLGLVSSEIVVVSVTAFSSGSGVTYNHANSALQFTGAGKPLNGKLIPSSDAEQTYAQLISVQDKRVIVAYGDQATATANAELWDPITIVASGQTEDSVAKMLTYLDSNTASAPTGLTVAHFGINTRIDTGPFFYYYENERWAAAKQGKVNVLASYFYSEGYLGDQSIALNLIAATTSSTSGAIKLAESVGVVLMAAMLLLL